MRTVAIWIRKIPMRKDMPCGVVNLCQGRSLEREVTYSKRLSMSVEPRSMPKRFNNSRKKKEDHGYTQRSSVPYFIREQ